MAGLGLNNLHHAGAGVFGHLRLHGRGTGRGLRSGTRRPGPGRDPRSAERLLLARRGQGLQPVGILLPLAERRFGNYWFQSGTPAFLIETLTRRDLPTPDLRRGQGASVPDRPPSPARRTTGGATGRATRTWTHAGAWARPCWESSSRARPARRRRIRNCFWRRRRTAPQGAVRLRPVAHERPRRKARGPLRERSAASHGAGRGGQRQPEARRHGDTRRRARLPVRIQGDGARAGGDRAAAGEGLRGQIPLSRAFGPPGGVQLARDGRKPR